MGSKRKIEKKFSKQARKMSNEELRAALWDVRNKTESQDGSSEELFILESIYSEELKRRELLEWALRTRTDD